MMKICLVPLLSIVLATLAAGVAVAAPEEVTGMPVITDGDSIRIGKCPHPHPWIDARAGTPPIVPLRPGRGLSLWAQPSRTRTRLRRSSASSR